MDMVFSPEEEDVTGLLPSLILNHQIIDNWRMELFHVSVNFGFSAEGAHNQFLAVL
jgi:hypothetical protein